MRKVRRAHLWIGLIASLFIFVEALTGLLLTEPWLIGQSGGGAFEGGQGMRGNFQPGQFNQGQGPQSQSSADTAQSDGNNGQTQSSSGGNGQVQGQNNFGGNRQFRSQNGLNRNANFLRNGQNQGSIMGIIRGLHEGRIGTTNIKWLIDLIAIAMMALTGTGIYLSINVLRAEKKRTNV
jgi:hypothetical protein